MKLSYKSGGGSFEPCPEYTGRAVCVDVTPPEKQQSQYGEREVFKLVFEVEETRQDGSPFCVWSKPFTPSLNEKANLRKFLKQWFGRDLNAQELQEFDTEDLIGKPAFLVVIHEEGNNGETYSNISAITPHKDVHGEALVPSGKYTRKKDRENKQSSEGKDESQSANSQYRKAETPPDAGREDWTKTEVHVGKHAGVQVGDLDVLAIDALVYNWIPVYEGMEKPRAADKRLAAALKEAKAEIDKNNDKADEEVPY